MEQFNLKRASVETPELDLDCLCNEFTEQLILKSQVSISIYDSW